MEISAPPGVLKRAANLLNSKDPIVKDLSDKYKPGQALIPVSLPNSRSNAFGLAPSLKRRFRSLRASSGHVRRSNSLSGDRNRAMEGKEDAGRIRPSGYSKSTTDVSVIVETLLGSAKTYASLGDHMRTSTPRLEGPPRREPVDHGLTKSTSFEALPLPDDQLVPQILQQGVSMTKISLRKHGKLVFRLDPDLGQIMWQSKKLKIVRIENIKEIRSGVDARYTREQFQVSWRYQKRWMTIVYVLDGNYKLLHVIADTDEIFQIWDKALRDLHALRLELLNGLGTMEMRHSLWEKQVWRNINRESGHRLAFEEIQKLCRFLNINFHPEDLLRLFQQADAQRRQFLEFEGFRQFVKLLKVRPEIERLYKKILQSGSHESFHFGVFEKFMKEKQMSPLPSSELLSVFKRYSTLPIALKDAALSPPEPESVMTLGDFTSFLFSPDNSAFADQHRGIWQDMTRPLSEYLISSSHNTYLTGHQLLGESTVEGYVRVLLHGCRSVEVDIFDGEQEPLVFHGKTLTSKISLREVCQTISKYGFIVSPYPIIISAEVHCNLAGQDMIADIMTEEFGDRLVRVVVDSEGTAHGIVGMGTFVDGKIDQLPSPEDLKGRILLKTKHRDLAARVDLSFGITREDDIVSEAVVSESTDEEVVPDSGKGFFRRRLSSRGEEDGRGRRRPSDTLLKGQLTNARNTLLKHARRFSKSPAAGVDDLPVSSRTTAPFASPSRSNDMSPSIQAPSFLLVPSPSSPSQRRSSETKEDMTSPKQRMSFALVALLVYTVGVKFRGINKKEKYPPEHTFSLSENMVNRMLKFGMWDLIKHTKTHLVRTYPKGSRVNSSNYEPHRFWAAGLQMASLNWQTFDLGYMINYAMFQRNGRCGYVLKPDAIRLAQKDRLTKRSMHSFNVTIISAQQLPRPRGNYESEKAVIDPFVEVTLYIPDWPLVRDQKREDRSRSVVGSEGRHRPPRISLSSTEEISPLPGRVIASRTNVVKKNGWNPVWEENLALPFDCVGDMFDLIFVRFAVRQESKSVDEPLAIYCSSLGSLQHGFRHLPLHDAHLSQFLFSTLFVDINVAHVV